MTEEKSLKEEITEEILKKINEEPIKTKKWKLPSKAKVKGGKMKKGWVGIFFVNTNKSVTLEKQKVESGTYKTKDGNIHVTDGHEIFYVDGKFPCVWQRYDKLNPTNLFPQEKDKDECYGQDMVFKRMKSDLIKPKRSFGGILWFLIIAAAAYFILTKFHIFG